jgi:hypothetical protein
MSDHPHSNLPPELTGMLADKKEERKNAHAFGWLGAGMKTAVGAVAGFAAGAVAWTGVAVHKTMSAFRQKGGTLENFVREYDKLPPEAQQKYVEELAQDIERSGGISGVMMRSPGTTVLVGAALGAGYAFHRHSSQHAKDRERAEKDVANLESLASKWQERVAQAEIVPGPQSHAIH